MSFSDQVKETTLHNVKKEDDYTVYIGRENSYYNLHESVHKNPFTLDSFSRATAIANYRVYLLYRLLKYPQYRETFTDLAGEKLACWCHPKDCHGDVLIETLESVANNCDGKSITEVEYETVVRKEVLRMDTSSLSLEGVEILGRLEEALDLECLYPHRDDFILSVER